MPANVALHASEESRIRGGQANHEVSKAVCVSEMRSLQRDTLAFAHSKVLESIPMCEDPERPKGEKAIIWANAASTLCSLVRAYIELRNAIRIEKGLIKPGSRNVSVREEPKELVRRGRNRGAHNASATLASAAAALGISPTGTVTGPPAIEVESVHVSEHAPNKPV